MVFSGDMSTILFCLSFFKMYFELKDNCFTIRCGFLPYINMNQPWVCMRPLPLGPPSRLPRCPTPLGWHRALAGAPESYSRSPLALCFPNGSVHVSTLLSPFVPPCVQKSVLYVCTSTAALQTSPSGSRF